MQFLKLLTISITEVNAIFKPSNYLRETSNIKFNVELTLINDDDCTGTLSKLLFKDFQKSINFSLYKYLTRGVTFKKLVLDFTLSVCVFIRYQFPACVSSAEELFELFHAVFNI